MLHDILYLFQVISAACHLLNVAVCPLPASCDLKYVISYPRLCADVPPAASAFLALLRDISAECRTGTRLQIQRGTDTIIRYEDY